MQILRLVATRKVRSFSAVKPRVPIETQCESGNSVLRACRKTRDKVVMKNNIWFTKSPKGKYVKIRIGSTRESLVVTQTKSTTSESHGN